jgi:hypothetical protein
MQISKDQLVTTPSALNYLNESSFNSTKCKILDSDYEGKNLDTALDLTSLKTGTSKGLTVRTGV